MKIRTLLRKMWKNENRARKENKVSPVKYKTFLTLLELNRDRQHAVIKIVPRIKRRQKLIEKGEMRSKRYR